MWLIPKWMIAGSSFTWMHCQEVLHGLLLFTEELACGEGFVIDTPNILASKLALGHMVLFSSQFQIICQAVIIVPVTCNHHVIGFHEWACSHAITPLIHQQPQHRLSGCNFQWAQPLIVDINEITWCHTMAQTLQRLHKWHPFPIRHIWCQCSVCQEFSLVRQGLHVLVRFESLGFHSCNHSFNVPLQMKLTWGHPFAGWKHLGCAKCSEVVLRAVGNGHLKIVGPMGWSISDDGHMRSIFKWFLGKVKIQCLQFSLPLTSNWVSTALHHSSLSQRNLLLTWILNKVPNYRNVWFLCNMTTFLIFIITWLP